MKYLLLIYGNEKIWGKMTEAEHTKMMGEFMQFSQAIGASGHYKAGSQLQPTATAKSVQVRDGKRLVTDGPFAETREQLGGYYLIEAKDLDEAIEIAARIPSSRLGTIEVRPLVEVGAPATAGKMLEATCLRQVDTLATSLPSRDRRKRTSRVAFLRTAVLWRNLTCDTCFWFTLASKR